MDSYSSGILAAILTLALALPSCASDVLPQRINGDVGFGGYYTHSIIKSDSDKFDILPYLDFDYGRMFARVDTIGIKTLKLGF